MRLPDQGGGTRHFQLSLELVKAGHDVTLIASPISYLTGQPEPGLGEGIQLRDGVRLLWLDSPPYRGNSLARVWNMLVFSLKARYSGCLSQLPQPDVIIGSSPHLFAAFAAQRLARARAVPYVMEVRDLWPQTLIDVGGIGRYHPLVLLFRWLEWRCYRSASRIISLLPAAWRYIEAHGAAQGSVSWIPNGIDLSAYPPRRGPTQGDRFVVTYAGTHGLANALDRVVDAAVLLREQGYGKRVLFRLIGDGAEKSRLIQRAEVEVPKMVEFLDPVPKSEIADRLVSSDVFIAVLKDSPLYRWGISLNKLFDYLAMERPVIFSGQAPANPVSESGGGIVVPAEDAQAIADGIKRLLEMSPVERVEMGRAGRRYIEIHHSMASLASRLELVLMEVVQS